MKTPELTAKISQIESNSLLKITSPQTGDFLGRLFEKDGKLHFEGKANECAKVFFNQMVKEYSLMKKNSEMLEMLEGIYSKYEKDGHLLNVSPSKIKQLIKEAKEL